MFLLFSIAMSHPRNVLLLCICLTCALLVVSCSKSDAPVSDKDGNDLPGHINGMGPSTEALQGQLFHFSAGVAIDGGIKGVSALDSQGDYCQVIGSGSFVLISMELVNNTGKDTLLVLPAGLSFASQSLEDQNGLLIQDVPVYLAKNTSCKVLLYTYCLNEHRHASSDESRYDFGPVCNATPIKELIQLLADKKVNLAPGEKASLDGAMGDIQLWIWQITDGEGLTASDKQRISVLENK